MTELSPTPTVLRKIVDRKWQEVEARQRTKPLDELKATAERASPCRGFIQAIEQSLDARQPAVIAEIKKASPSKGVIRADFRPAEIALRYAQAGASCLSVLTDRDFFQGHEDYLKEAREACDLPVLRKDFIVSPYQVYEARAIGADCILLIAACLTLEDMLTLESLALTLGMDVLVEVHNHSELEAALRLQTRLLGINNRNLHTFDVTLDTTIELLQAIPADKQRIIVTESGIRNKEDVEKMQRHGVNTFLVGETFMRAEDPGSALKSLFF